MIIPTINGVFTKEGHHFHFPKNYAIVPSFRITDALFEKRMNGIGYGKDSGSSFVISWELSDSLKDEAYIADITSSGVKIFSKDEKGYQYALNSLYQNIVTKNGYMRPMIIEDAPRFAYRGLLIDTCRHFVSVKELKKIIDQCCLLKLNRIHLHLSDDQGFRFESKKYPKLNTVGSYRELSSTDPLVTSGKAEKGDIYGGFYSQKELKALVRYASDRNVTIVPEIEMPGHCSAMLAAYPELSCSGKECRVRGQFGIFKRVLCPGKESVYEFIESLLDEIISVFPSEYIHLGGDECPHSEWDSCPECLALKEREHFDNEGLQAYFINRVSDYLASRKRKAIVFNESFRSHSIGSGTVCQYWNEMNLTKSETVREAAKGREFIMSNMNAFYFDYPYADTPLRATLKYKAVMKNSPVPEKNILGFEGALWTEWIADDETLEHMIYPRLLALSEVSWNKCVNAREFVEKCRKYLNFEKLQALSPMPWEKAELSKDEAILAIVMNMKSLGMRYRMPKEEADPDNVTFSESENKNADPAASLRAFFAEKMQFGYLKKDVDKAVNIILGKEK